MTVRKLKTCTRDVDEKLRVPETFYMLLDMDRGTLAFQVIFGNIIFQGRIFLLLTTLSLTTYYATSPWWPSPGEQWLFGSCLLGTSRRRTLSNCFCCLGTLRGIKAVPWHASDTRVDKLFFQYFDLHQEFVYLIFFPQVTLTYINSHHFDRDSSPSWGFWESFNMKIFCDLILTSGLD